MVRRCLRGWIGFGIGVVILLPGGAALGGAGDAHATAVTERSWWHHAEPEEVLARVRTAVRAHRAWHYVLWRRERIDGRMPDLPDHLYVRYRCAPLALYLRWLPGGRYVGRELLYDVQREPDRLYVHEGGVLGLVSIWLPIDSWLVRRDTRHTPYELGLLPMLDLLGRTLRRLRAVGLDRRVVPSDASHPVVTYELVVTDPSALRIGQVRLVIAIDPIRLRELRVWDTHGQLLEAYRFERLEPFEGPDEAFSPDWSEYDF